MTSRQPAAKKTTIRRIFNTPALSPFGANSSLANPIGPISLKRPANPAREEDQRHRERQVDIGIGAAEERFGQLKAFGGLMSPADRADAGNQADPVRGEDEDEDRAEEPERPADQMRADDAFQKPVEAFDQPLQEILRSLRHLLHAPGRELRKDDEAHGDDPGDEHGVGDGKAERTRDLDGLLRQAMFLARRGRHRGAGSEDPRHHAAHRHARRASVHHVTDVSAPAQGSKRRPVRSGDLRRGRDEDRIAAASAGCDGMRMMRVDRARGMPLRRRGRPGKRVRAA